MLEELKVSVSGASIYKAVSNYLKNDPGIQQMIKEKAEFFLGSEALETAVRKRLDNEFASWRIRDELTKEMKEIVHAEMKKFLTQEKLEEVTKKVFASMLTK